ncbi:hypothetical protein CC80DRAFT_314163 [Byssothecium circinans]|uniref:Uncharacterized protein n=1 Tax=Byssothecium circinans TaxID=147558 RepID=A0A6A5U522_9PLEO|nr:hypothetical protein CC80DRAFT_314163 [Byssothecium circinans]
MPWELGYRAQRRLPFLAVRLLQALRLVRLEKASTSASETKEGDREQDRSTPPPPPPRLTIVVHNSRGLVVPEPHQPQFPQREASVIEIDLYPH